MIAIEDLEMEETDPKAASIAKKKATLRKIVLNVKIIIIQLANLDSLGIEMIGEVIEEETEITEVVTDVIAEIGTIAKNSKARAAAIEVEAEIRKEDMVETGEKAHLQEAIDDHHRIKLN